MISGRSARAKIVPFSEQSAFYVQEHDCVHGVAYVRYSKCSRPTRLVVAQTLMTSLSLIRIPIIVTVGNAPLHRRILAILEWYCDASVLKVFLCTLHFRLNQIQMQRSLERPYQLKTIGASDTLNNQTIPKQLVYMFAQRTLNFIDDCGRNAARARL